MCRSSLFLLSGLCLLATAAQALDQAGSGTMRPDGPARMEGSNLPPPRSWRGSMRDFEPAIWQHGIWRSALHNHRFGWWWDVGKDHFAFDQPIFPYPDLLTPAGYPVGWWHWCDPSQEFYPYVTLCPAPWTSVPPELRRAAT